MTRSVPIRYRDFWDVPRIFLAEHRGQRFLFDCPFDEDTEDFPHHYHVYLLPALTEDEWAVSWESWRGRAIRCLGVVPIKSVLSDAPRRTEVGTELLDDFLDRPAVPPA